MKPRARGIAAVASVGLVLSLLALSVLPIRAQEPAAPESISDVELQAAIDRLGSLDYETRTGAARTVRRTDGTQAVPALLRAVDAHADGYVRFRALVLLTGFNDPRTVEAMRGALGSPNDRLRTVAYGFFEHNPDAAVLPELLAAVDREFAEFVRPSLVRALAAHAPYDAAGVEPLLVREAGRGEDFFRSAVIEALGDYRAAYATDAVGKIAAVDGPLQDDAALALGKMGDARALPVLEGLLGVAPRERLPSVAAGICLLGQDCALHEAAIIKALSAAEATPGFQDVLRSSAAALGALGVSGRVTAVEALFRIGLPSRDPARAPIALALATVALRNTPVLLSVLGIHPSRDDAISLLAEGFDMLEEDLLKERFFAFARRQYWGAGAATREGVLMQTLITRLDF